MSDISAEDKFKFIFETITSYLIQNNVEDPFVYNSCMNVAHFFMNSHELSKWLSAEIFKIVEQRYKKQNQPFTSPHHVFYSIIKNYDQIVKLENERITLRYSDYTATVALLVSLLIIPMLFDKNHHKDHSFTDGLAKCSMCKECMECIKIFVKNDECLKGFQARITKIAENIESLTQKTITTCEKANIIGSGLLGNFANMALSFSLLNFKSN
jgi:hypothetical protein